MTTAQRNYYFGLWGKACKKLRAFSNLSDEELDAERERINAEAFEEVKGFKPEGRVSGNDLNQDMLDRVFAKFKAIIDSSDLGAQLDALEQPRKRRIWGIEKLGFPHAYIETVSLRKFDVREWRQLDFKQLSQLKMTLEKAAKSKEQTS